MNSIGFSAEDCYRTFTRRSQKTTAIGDPFAEFPCQRNRDLGSQQAARGPRPSSTVLPGSSDGSLPIAGVVIGKGGMLYGTTESGGTLGAGTVTTLTALAG